MNNTDLSNRVVVITGAAGDIGMAMARRFADAGARLALLDRDLALLHTGCNAAFGAGHLQPQLRRADRRDIAARTGTDNKDVIVEFSHFSRPLRDRSAGGSDPRSLP